MYRKAAKTILMLILLLTLACFQLGIAAGNEENKTTAIGVASSVYGNESPQDPEQYAEWKQKLFSGSQTLPSRITAAGYDNNKMYNDYIEYVVESEGPNNGRFTIGTTGGAPLISNDDYKKMLYGHPYPWSSYTTIRIDDQNHIYNPVSQYPSPDPADLSNTSEHVVGEVSIRQIVKIVQSSSTGNDDTVEIKYVIRNDDTVAHDVGLRIMLDTMLGSNDNAPFRVPGIGAVTNELELSGEGIPEYWQAFDSLVNPNVMSQGTLEGSMENRPDRVQFTNWSRAYYSPWGYVVNPALSNGDSAVCIYWNPRTLAPGQSCEYVTLYGVLSESSMNMRPPLALYLTGASNIKATENGYTPNPFTVTAYVTNIGNSAAYNVKARIQLPPGLKLSNSQQEEIDLGMFDPFSNEKQCSWQVEIEPDNVDRKLSYQVAVSGDNTDPKSLSREILIPASMGTKRNIVIVIPGIAATSLLISDGEGVHNVWPPRLNNITYDINLLRCSQIGYPEENLRLGEPLQEYYGNLYNNLTSAGFETYYFPYDWRRGNAYSAENLSVFIDSLHADKVNIVAHSMGGLVAAQYIKSGDADKVNKLITIGTPYLGSPKSLFVFETGEFLGDYRDWFIADELELVAPNISSVYQLLPSYFYFDYNNTYYIQKHVDNGWFDKDTLTDIWGSDATTNLLKSRNWFVGGLYDKAFGFHSNLDLLRTLQSVDSYFIIGDNKDTIGKIKEKFVMKDGYEVFEECEDVTKINGDGTVPIISASIGGRTGWVYPNHTYYITEEHSQLPNNSNVINQAINILCGNTEPVGGIRREPEASRSLKLVIECPVELHVYDSEGNHMGPINDHEYEEKINGGSFYRLGDKKIGFLEDGDYNVKLIGTGTGTMNYTIQKINEQDSVIRTIRFDGVEVTPQTVITSDSDMDSAITLKVDEDGNGSIDRIIQPSVVLDEAGSNDYNPPTVVIKTDGVQGSDGWYTSDVNVTVEGNDSESGVSRIEYIINGSGEKVYDSPLSIGSEGINSFYAVSIDNNRNKSGAEFKEIKIDKTPPEIILTAPVDGGEYVLNDPVRAGWSAEDSLSGIDLVSGTIQNGDYIDTGSVGTKTMSITARDKAGNQIVKTVTYQVRYDYSGILRPVNPDGSSVFKQGRTIPVKFSLKDAQGKYITNASAKLYLAKIISGNVIKAEAAGSSSADNEFRYDSTENQYIFNWSTKELSPGKWELQIFLDDSSMKKMTITLK